MDMIESLQGFVGENLSLLTPVDQLPPSGVPNQGVLRLQFDRSRPLRAEELRRDIEVPAAVLAKWDRETWRDPQLRPLLERIVRYRQHVLAIFENLIGHDSATQKLQ